MDADEFEDDLFLPIEHPYRMLTILDSPIGANFKRNFPLRNPYRQGIELQIQKENCFQPSCEQVGYFLFR